MHYLSETPNVKRLPLLHRVPYKGRSKESKK
nr:MAG TPA: hypothetical protein [Caudoviricetes sp.]